ncbi:MAG: nucleoside triphosphate pyrophosphohydrolase [Hyphomicrobiales bacterium]
MTPTPPKPPVKYDMDGLRYIMRELRRPVTGCAWDLEQDFKSIGEYTIEEAYEVIDAINKADYEELAEELGDLLLQPLFHAQIAEDLGLFDFDKVIWNICDKMIRRHPHVFANENDEVIELTDGLWQRIKQQEKAAKPHKNHTLLDGVRFAPSLTYAQELQEKAATVGFDWPEIEQVKDKITEELDEFYVEVQAGDRKKQQEEFGDLLFSLVNYGRHLGIDCDAALQGTNEKFIHRFNKIESEITASNQEFEDHNIEELERLWQKAKKD